MATFMESLQGGVQFGQGLKQSMNRDKISSLASQAYGATDPAQRQGAIQQAIGLDAGQGFQVEGQLDQTEDRRTKTMVNMAKLLTSVPEQARPALYAKMVPTLGQFGLQELPPVYDQTTAPAIMSAADSIVKALGSGQDNQRNAIVAPGSAVVDPQTGQVIYERAYTPKNQTIEVAGPDGRPRQYTFDALNNRYIPATLGDPTSAAPQTNQAGMPMVPAMDIPAIQADYQDVANRHGLRITSMERSASENAGIPGAAANSQHVGKTAVDYSTQGLSEEKIRQVEAEMRAKGYEGGYTTRGTAPHMHFELPPNRASALRNSSTVVAGPSPFVGRSPEEQAALTTAAQEAAKLAVLPESERIKVDAAVDQATRTKEAQGRVETRLELEQNLPKIIDNSARAVQTLTKALNHPGLAAAVGASSKLDPRNFVPGTEAANFRVLLDQIKGGTFLEAFQSLKGGGAITETEGRKAEQAIGRLDTAQTEEEFKVALNELLDIAKNAPAKAQAKLANFGGNSGSPAGRTVTRRGTLNGRKVVQYSDGTTEYAD